MTLAVLLALASVGIAMKLVALLTPAPAGSACRTFWFWVAPLPSPTSLARPMQSRDVPRLILRTALSLGAVVVGYWIYWQVVGAVHISGVFLGYLAAPILLLVTELFASATALLWLPSGRLLPPLHDRPLLARSLADFWGRRWNLWMRDWFRFAIFNRLQARPALALVVVFAVSGLMHEWALNLPLFLVTGKRLFGTMMTYFFVQAVGLLCERRFLKTAPRVRALMAWLLIVVPAPLVINEGSLRALHLWPA